jgi:RNA polymerase sigma-54 factor
MKMIRGGCFDTWNQKILQNIIEEDKKPLDDQLPILKEKGYPIWRTIAKYREQLDIPVARMRKKI